MPRGEPHSRQVGPHAMTARGSPRADLARFTAPATRIRRCPRTRRQRSRHPPRWGEVAPRPRTTPTATASSDPPAPPSPHAAPVTLVVTDGNSGPDGFLTTPTFCGITVGTVPYPCGSLGGTSNPSDPDATVLIGSGTSITVTGTGTLSVLFNDLQGVGADDTSYYADNHGAYSVTATNRAPTPVWRTLTAYRRTAVTRLPDNSDACAFAAVFRGGEGITHDPFDQAIGRRAREGPDFPQRPRRTHPGQARRRARTGDPGTRPTRMAPPSDQTAARPRPRCRARGDRSDSLPPARTNSCRGCEISRGGVDDCMTSP
jgi:hypothetical protein